MDNLVAANLRQRPVRSLVSVLGVALGVALVMLFTGLARGLSNDLQRRSANVRAEIIFTRSGGSLDLTNPATNLSVKYAEELRKIEGVESAVPVILYISQGGGGFGLEQVNGVDWNEFAAMNEMSLVAGRAPQANDEVVIDETKARNNNLSVGSTVKVFGDLPYRVVGIYTPESGARVKMSLAAAQDALQAPNKCTFIYVKARHGDAETTARNINEKLPGNTIQATRDVFAKVERSIPFLNTFLRVLVGLAALVSALVVMLAMYTTITERTREIGILKAMGASKSLIVWVIEQEAILISLLGLGVGFGLALVSGSFIKRAYGLPFEYGWRWALAAAVIGLVGGALGALYPAIRAANLDPVNALAYE
jgi:putative ABC transport system permease protein